MIAETRLDTRSPQIKIVDRVCLNYTATGVTVLAALTTTALYCSWWPLFIMPAWIQALAKIAPYTWANESFNKLFVFGMAFVTTAAMRVNVRSA